MKSQQRNKKLAAHFHYKYTRSKVGIIWGRILRIHQHLKTLPSRLSTYSAWCGQAEIASTHILYREEYTSRLPSPIADTPATSNSKEFISQISVPRRTKNQKTPLRLILITQSKFAHQSGIVYILLLRGSEIEISRIQALLTSSSPETVHPQPPFSSSSPSICCSFPSFRHILRSG